MTTLLSSPLGLAAVAVGGVLLLILAVRVGKAARHASRERIATWALVVPALMSLSMSASTSYRFFGTALGITDPSVRMALCGSGEALIIGLTIHAWAAKSKASAWAVYLLVGVQSIPAFEVSGGAGGIVRMVLGPIMLAVLLHKLLGIETKFNGNVSNGLLASAARELRERITARLGIGRRGADSAEIARNRAADRAVRLATRKRWGRRSFDRLADAIDGAQHGLDPDTAAVAEAAVVARIVRRQSVMALRQITGGHVWSTTAVSGAPVIATPRVEIAETGTDEDTTAPAEPVISGWTGARVSVRRRPGRRPRHLRPTRTSQSPHTPAEQPQQALATTQAPDTPAPAAQSRLGLGAKVLVPAMRAAYPGMPVDTIADKLRVHERTVRRYLPAPDVRLDHANGTALTPATTEGD